MLLDPFSEQAQALVPVRTIRLARQRQRLQEDFCKLREQHSLDFLRILPRLALPTLSHGDGPQGDYPPELMRVLGLKLSSKAFPYPHVMHSRDRKPVHHSCRARRLRPEVRSKLV